MMESIGSKEEGHEEQIGVTVSEWSDHEMALPGFRFHPTEEELVGYYLRRMVQGRRNSVELIASLDLYQYDPWELPAMAFMGEKEWFFFCPRDKKYPNGARPNRVTASGYWKATGTDRPVRCSGDSRCIGLKKTLVFYTGRAPRGNKTEWIMNEYRMPKPAERSISVMTSDVNSINYSFSTYDNLVIKNDVALCRIYRKSSSALSSINFISAIASKDFEERTSRMLSRFENNHTATAAAAHVQQQEHPHDHIQRLQEQALPPNTLTVRVSSSEMPIPSLPAARSGNGTAHGLAQQSTKATTTSLISHTHAQLVEAGRQQQQLDGGAAAQGRFDHGAAKSIIDSSTTSEEASRQLQLALDTAIAKFDGVGSSATVTFKDGESMESNISDMFGRLRSRLVQEASAAAACPSKRVMRSHSPESATAVQNQNRRAGSLISQQFGHQLSSCSRGISSSISLQRRSSDSDNVPAAFTPIKSDPSCCSIPRISIPSSFIQCHVNNSPSTTTTSRGRTPTTACAEGVTAAPSAIALDTMNSSHISAASTQLDDQVQSLVNASSIPLSTDTYSLKRSRFTRVQQLVGENCPMAKIPPVAQYWRQSSSAPNSPAAAQLSAFDALSGLTFQY